MFIPTKLRVGFVKRNGTFTGKLGYVIYYDEKGKIRKEMSFNSWRDKEIEVLELDNDPRDGFTFNKGIQRDGYWGNGRSVIRVYDSRDFEFEISVDNLIGILMHANIDKREITEKCVYAWYGSDLVLLPVNSVEYESSVKYTAKQSEKVSAKNLIKGATYSKKKSEELLTYIGFFEWFDFKGGTYYTDDPKTHYSKGKKHVFYNGHSFDTPSVSSVLAECINPEQCENYAGIVDTFFGTTHSQKITGIAWKPVVFPASEYFSCYVLKMNDLNSFQSLGKSIGKNRYDKIWDKNSIKKLVGETYSVTYNTGNEYSTVITSSSARDRNNRYGYSWGYGYNRAEPDTAIGMQLYNKLESMTFEPFDENDRYHTPDKHFNVNAEQQLEAVTELGFGEILYVLENGNFAPYK